MPGATGHTSLVDGKALAGGREHRVAGPGINKVQNTVGLSGSLSGSLSASPSGGLSGSAVRPVFPDKVVAHPGWLHARAVALAVLDVGGKGMLLGAPGSGKSLLLRELARTVREEGRAVHLVGDAGLLGDVPADDALLVDEADRIGAGALAALGARPGPVLLAALPSFADRVPAGLGFHCVRLDRLSAEDVARMVAGRLVAAGGPGWDPEAVLALTRHSGGLVRLVNTVGSAAVFLAMEDGAALVGSRHVEEAAAMRGGLGEDGDGVEPGDLPARVAEVAGVGGGWRRRAVLGGALAASAGFAAWLLAARPGHEPRAAVATRADGVAPRTGGEGGEGAADRVAQPDAAQPGTAQPGAAQPDVGEGGPAAGSGAAPRVGSVDAAPPAAAPAAVAPEPRAAAPVRPAGDRVAAPPPGGVAAGAAPNGATLFRGPIFNETMGQGGQVTLVIHREASDGSITAEFDASQGLSGRGVLAGSVSGNGRVTASGQLMMGRTPFSCDLSGVWSGNTLTGSATFVRSGSGTVYHSRFSLVRA